MQECNAVIFDLGGVLLDINYQATEKALRGLLGPRSDHYYLQTQQSPLFDDLETGRIEPHHFHQGLCELAGITLSSTAITEAWNAMLGRMPQARMAFVQKVAARRRVFLLSNTNAIHKAAFDQIIAADLPGQPFDDFFEAAYYSHLIGLRKPDPAIYRYVTDRHGLDPARTLFIDDNQSNVEGARLAGLQAFHLQGELLLAPLDFLLH
ncbi:MAG TPA: HAD family phosphatase [Oligoflexus sp.]|uniref:HAD family hydrolase n=1 Tax=Oligoflexus sp. TaxID=1971216 RepID=UPI002D42FB52|nr:HAD family phosphatase [Oligoflexus sp.]HYX37193.1 HAD family phosphatase [Oligoflexus sp.]